MAIYHNHASVISRASGKSSVRSAAYQSGQNLTHEQQRVASVDGVRYRKDLVKGIITDELRDTMHGNGIELSENATVEKLRGENGKVIRGKWTIADGDKTYTVKSYRETAWQKDENGDKWINPETGKGKRIVVAEGVDIHADVTHYYKTKEDVMDTFITKTPERFTVTDKKGRPKEYVAPNWIIEAGNDEIQDRQKIWNEFEKSSNRRDSALALRFEVSLPREFSDDIEKNRSMLEDFCFRNFGIHGSICDVAIHRVEAGDSRDKDNPLYNDHSHIMVATRIATDDGFENIKNPAFTVDEGSLMENEIKRKAHLEKLRKSWADIQNEHLEKAGFDVRVDHRSYEERGISKIPTQHMGYRASALEKKDVQTVIGIENEIIKRNNIIIEKYDPTPEPAPDYVIPRHDKDAVTDWLNQSQVSPAFNNQSIDPKLKAETANTFGQAPPPKSTEKEKTKEDYEPELHI